MKRTDHILALTAAILNADTQSATPALAKMQESYTLDNPRQPGVVSIGASDGITEIPFKSWIDKLQQSGIRNIKFTAYQFNDERLPAHIAAGFAGPSDLVLEITTAQHVSTWVMRVLHSPANDLSAEQFILLINNQSDPTLCWARVSTLILESNGLNQRTLFPVSETSSYLVTDEGRSVFAYMASDLIREVQIEATIFGHGFLIPDSLKQQFIKYEPSLHFPDDGREHVYLYSRRDVTPAELLALVDAQPFAGETWKQLNKTLAEYADPDLPAGPEDQWRNRLTTMHLSDFQLYVSAICRSICTLCEDAGIKPVIPPQLATAFGPDETEQKRAAARSGSSGLWQIQSTLQPWEYYQFVKMENVPSSPIISFQTTQQLFTDSLKETQVFAASIQSAFEEAFGLAYFVLTADLPDGNYSDEMIEVVTARAVEGGFSERAVTNLRNACWVATAFSSLGWDAQRVKGLLAINLSDVFGGMGSWNDEYVEHDQETYHRLSGELYDHMRNYFAALLTV